jgi:cytidylate kinase
MERCMVWTNKQKEDFAILLISEGPNFEEISKKMGMDRTKIKVYADQLKIDIFFDSDHIYKHLYDYLPVEKLRKG